MLFFHSLQSLRPGHLLTDSDAADVDGAHEMSKEGSLNTYDIPHGNLVTARHDTEVLAL